MDDKSLELQQWKDRCYILEQEVRLLREQRRGLLDRIMPTYPELQNMDDAEVLSHFGKGESLESIIHNICR